MNDLQVLWLCLGAFAGLVSLLAAGLLYDSD